MNTNNCDSALKLTQHISLFNRDTQTALLYFYSLNREQYNQLNIHGDAGLNIGPVGLSGDYDKDSKRIDNYAKSVGINYTREEALSGITMYTEDAAFKEWGRCMAFNNGGLYCSVSPNQTIDALEIQIHVFWRIPANAVYDQIIGDARLRLQNCHVSAADGKQAGWKEDSNPNNTYLDGDKSFYIVRESNQSQINGNIHGLFLNKDFDANFYVPGKAILPKYIKTYLSQDLLKLSQNVYGHDGFQKDGLTFDRPYYNYENGIYIDNEKYEHGVCEHPEEGNEPAIAVFRIPQNAISFHFVFGLAQVDLIKKKLEKQPYGEAIGEIYFDQNDKPAWNSNKVHEGRLSVKQELSISSDYTTIKLVTKNDFSKNYNQGNFGNQCVWADAYFLISNPS